MLRINRQNVVMLISIMPGVINLCVVTLNVIVLSAIMTINIMLKKDGSRHNNKI
jgi:hypothetical protein